MSQAHFAKVNLGGMQLYNCMQPYEILNFATVIKIITNLKYINYWITMQQSKMSICCQHKADKDKKKHTQFWNSPDDKFPKIKWDKHAKSDQ